MENGGWMGKGAEAGLYPISIPVGKHCCVWSIRCEEKNNVWWWAHSPELRNCWQSREVEGQLIIGNTDVYLALQ